MGQDLAPILSLGVDVCKEIDGTGKAGGNMVFSREKSRKLRE
jgi:hypothetical protein